MARVIFRRTRTALCAIAALAVLPAAASADLPDLVSAAPSNVTTGSWVIGGQNRLLLRFDGYVYNQGPGRLHFGAQAPVGGVMTDVTQVLDGVPKPSEAEVIYEDSSAVNMDGHDHWHLQKASRYSLWLKDRTAQVAPAEKVGFCLLDGERISGNHPGGDSWCGDRTSTSLEMAISPGWRDTYIWQTPFQWVDATNVSPGVYWLQADADPDGVVVEQDEVNPPAGIPVVLPGHVPQAQALAAGARTVTLSTEEFRREGALPVAPEFRIVESPQHGTLEGASAGWFSDASLTYVPDDPADPAPDSFRYAARTQGAAFPNNPPTAAVTLAGGGGMAAISGAPETMVAGTSVQLRSVSGATWSADTGAITPAGVYTAPATTGTATVRAAAPNGTVSTVAIRIVPVPPSEPAPVPLNAPAGDSVIAPATEVRRQPVSLGALPRRAIEAAAAQQVGRWVAVTTKPGRSGRLRVVLRRGSRTVASCATRVQAGQTSTCRLTRPRRGRGALRVVVVLKAVNGGTVTRRVTIRAAAHRH